MASDPNHDRSTSPAEDDAEIEDEVAPARDVRPDEGTAHADEALADERTPLEELAASLAERYAASRRPGAEPSPVQLVLDHADLLDTAYEHFQTGLNENGGTAGAPILSAAAEWLLDNFYLVQQALRQIREDMPRTYYHELPKLEGTWLRDYPRVYALMRQAVRHLDALIDISWVARFVSVYQERAALTMGELWAIPTMLRTALLELLIEAVARAIELPEEVKVGPSRARGEHRAAPGGGPIRLRTDLPDDVIVAHCIRSLRVVGNYEWEAFFEHVSRVEAVLRRDPAGIYARMEFDSRDRYRKVVEALALGSPATEV